MSRLSMGLPVEREKRTAKLQSYVTPEVREHYEQKVTPRRSLSDVVFEALEKQAAIEIVHQKIGARRRDS